MSAERVVFKLYPSDLTWLYADCRRCFYLKLRHRLWRPDGGFPSIFSKIDSAMKKHCFSVVETHLVCPDMPRGRFLLNGPKSVLSRSFSLDGCQSSFQLAGKPDAVVQWEDGSYGVVDFKTSSVKDKNVDRYADQIEIYSMALEYPQDGKPAFGPVSLGGLLVWEPDLFAPALDGPLSLGGKLTWIPVERRRDQLRETLKAVMGVLDGDGLPEPYSGCKFCNYPSELARLAQALAPDAAPAG